MSRTMLALGVLAWLGVVAMTAQVASSASAGPESFRLPLLIGLVASLLLVLSLGWCALYLVSTGWLLRDFAGRVPPESDLAGRVQAQPRLHWPWLAGGAVALAVALFALAIERAGGRIGTLAFVALAGGGLGAIALLMARGWVLLRRREGLLADLDRGVGP